MTKQINVMAHRGASGYAPENTLAAFQMALDMGADGIECDIHLTADAQFVVCHDDRIDRTSDGEGAITELTLSQIQSHDFGAKYGAQFAGETAPTLEQMLDVVKDMNPINIEIKAFGDGDQADALSALYNVLVRRGVLSNCIISSFNAQILKQFKRLYPDVYTCLLYSHRRRPAAYAQSLGCSAIHLHHARLTKRTVDNAHARGLKVNCWTADDENDIRRMIEIGCDGIITDYPDRVLKLLGRA